MNEEDGNEEAHLIDFRTGLWWTATDLVAREPIGTEQRGGGGGTSGRRGQVWTKEEKEEKKNDVERKI
jgi:hypothetical protein